MSMKNKDIQAKKVGPSRRYDALIVSVCHPYVYSVGKELIVSNARHKSWCAPNDPWWGLGAWLFESSLMDKIRAQNINNWHQFTHMDAKESKAYRECLGPFGLGISGSGGYTYDNGSVQKENSTTNRQEVGEQERSDLQVQLGKLYYIDVGLSVQHNERLIEGKKRPSWWQEPLPMIRTAFEKDAYEPSKGPSFGACAQMLVYDIINQCHKARQEEDLEYTQSIQEMMQEGCLVQLDNAQMRPLLNASKGRLSPSAGVDWEQSLRVLNTVWECHILEHECQESKATTKGWGL